MNRTFAIFAGSIVLCLSLSSVAAPADLLAGYAAQSKSTGFSAARGKTLHSTSFSGGKAETPSCSTCHGDDPRQPGRTPVGKTIKPMALSASPDRYADAAKVEKWFKRNCKEVLGRECTPQEKGDWLTYMTSQ